MNKNFNWKVYFLLLLASTVSTVAVLPYAFTLADEIIRQAPYSLPVIALLSTIQSTVLFATALFVGLLLAKKVGFKLPLIEAFAQKEKSQLDIHSLLKTAILFGIGAGVAIVFTDFLFTQIGVDVSLWEGNMPPFWMGFLASFYGGISEEILLRLFFMSFLAWLFSLTIKTENRVLENSVVMWSVICIASLLFGLGHLPITAAVTTVTPLVISRAIILNGIGGIIFGWLYWKKGLDSAMIAHFSADIVLHVIFPLLVCLLGNGLMTS